MTTFICEFCQSAIEDENDIRAAGPTSDEGFACKECYDQGKRKSHDGIFWQSPCGNNETVRDGAARFVRETFGVERKIVWGASPGEFRFADGYWCYVITCEAGQWHVRRSQTLTPQAKKRMRARREIQAKKATDGGVDA